MKKHLFPFEGGVEFLGVKAEGGLGGFFFSYVTFALCKIFVIFSNF